ncbi:MAG: radical SAM protein, partial [Armatimonadia bacterium]
RSAHQSAIGPSITFAQLLRLVGAVDGLWRLRFTTSHPKDLSEDLLRAIAETPAACEHLHLPIQAGDDVVLQRMGRRYTYAHYKALVDRAREIVPEISVTTDVMAGFPGETEEQFNNTMRAFEEIRFDQAFMFKYSDRPGTRAAKMSDKVPEKVKQQRLQRLVDLQNHVAREINQGQLGQVFEVLVEGRDEKSPEKMRGRTRQNKLMIFPGDENLIGKLVNVRAEEAYLWGFVGGSES